MRVRDGTQVQSGVTVRPGQLPVAGFPKGGIVKSAEMAPLSVSLLTSDAAKKRNTMDVLPAHAQL